MNTPFNKISAQDLASMLRVDYSSVTTWCRKSKINCVNVGDGNHNSRYEIGEDEARYIKKLFDQHGKRLWYKHYCKDWKTVAAEYKPKPVEVERTFDIYDEDDFSMLNTDGRLQSVLPKVEAPNTETIADFKMAATSDFDPEEILDTIIRAQDIKGQIKELEAELQKCRDIILKAI